MATLNLVQYGDPVLRERAREVKKFNRNLHQLLENMADTMYENEGVGLAAPQVGISKRVVVLDVGDGLLEIVNPQIVERDGRSEDTEGCLSVPGRTGAVPRASRIRVQACDRQGTPMVIEAEDLLSRALQHEIDHLDGVLILDRFMPGSTEST